MTYILFRSDRENFPSLSLWSYVYTYFFLLSIVVSHASWIFPFCHICVMDFSFCVIRMPWTFPFLLLFFTDFPFLFVIHEIWHNMNFSLLLSAYIYSLDCCEIKKIYSKINSSRIASSQKCSQANSRYHVFIVNESDEKTKQNKTILNSNIIFF